MLCSCNWPSGTNMQYIIRHLLSALETASGTIDLIKTVQQKSTTEPTVSTVY